jgi:hypothetical protein
MNRKSRILLTVLFIAMGLATIASSSCGCSPGFWKNHVDVWWETAELDGVYDPGVILAALEAKGNEPERAFRAEASAYLNSLGLCP